MTRLGLIAVAFAIATLGGCASTHSNGGSDFYGYGGWGNGGWGYGGYDSRYSRGGRSEPGNESGMYPARPDGGRGGGGGAARGGEAGM